MRLGGISKKGAPGGVRTIGSVLAAAVAGLPLALLATTPAPASAAPAPITIAYISSLTGPGGAQDGNSPSGFQARIALQNAEGGVHGHKLVPLVLDDQTNPSNIATVVQEADSKAFGIVSQSPLFFLAAKYPNQAGVPVTGSYDDGPEWGTQPYTNMFAADEGSVDPKYPVNTQIGNFLKAHGGSVLGAYGYGISPSSSRAAIATSDSFQHAGGKTGVLNTTVPFGSVDFSSIALVAKQKGINAMVPAMDANSNYALAQALHQAGVNLKATLYATGYEPDVINSPSWSTLQGAYFLSPFRPWSLPNAGTQQMQAAMEKYAHFSKSQFPTFGQYESWAGADLMIKGLEMAGSNPTQAAVIKDLRGLKSYNVNGLLPESINYSTIFGHDLPKTCAWVMQAQKTGFKLVSSTPTCGTDLPGTQTASAS
ncbi:MAG TPA: ABC transporter substrate-binding protein [Acidimicrobiales bacterium]|nr:ABC transporter substrate-binding protein [Acidimicrobiales bacterium]